MSKTVWYGGLVLLLLGVGYWWWQSGQSDLDELITEQVARGSVSEVVSVSGFVEADNTAELSFPAAGRVSAVLTAEGDEVEAGTLLATVAQSRLAAERQAAAANLTQAEAARDELVNGQTLEERAVTDATVAQAKSAWEQTVATELEKVQNARITLLSNDLVAYPEDAEEDAAAPTVSGSFICDDEGTYELEIYRSDTDSGFSIKYDGLERGIIPVTFGNPVPLGSCGLSVQFTAGGSYENSDWTISIPNTRSTTYTTYLQALALAEQQATQNIQAAKDAQNLAESAAERDIAGPRVEALLSANASVAAAQADLARADAQLADQSIYAPFAGMVTNIEKLPGEIATTEPFITLLAQDAFTLIARIPEIDITKVSLDQTITAIFDANPNESQTGTINFINPIATEIDGVAYFETKITLSETPSWLRAGLNADIDITINQKDDVLVLPQRFIERTPDGTFVQVLTGVEMEQQPVELGLSGTDGMVEVTNLEAGTTVVAP